MKKKYLKWVIVYLLLALLLTMFQLLGPVLVSRFFDAVATESVSYLLTIVLILMAAALSTGVLNVVCSVLDVKIKNKIVLESKQSFLHRILSMDYEILEKIPYGDQKSRYDFNSIYGDIAVSFLANTVMEVFTCLFIGTYLCWLNWTMGVVYIACLLVNSLIDYHIGNKTYQFSKALSGIKAKAEGKVAAVLNSVAYIKTNNNRDVVCGEINDIQREQARLQELHTKEVEIFDNIGLVLHNLIEATIFVMAAFMIKNQSVSVGEIYLFVAYMGWISHAFSTIWDHYIKYKEAKAKIDTIRATFVQEEGKTVRADDVRLEKNVSSLSVEGLHYRYDAGEFAIPEISMQLKVGDFVAVIGESGCGKSTMMKLLSGLYAPDSGVIRYNQTDITCTTPEFRSDYIAYVSQNATIMEDSLRNLIDFRRQNASEAELNRVIQMAGLSAFVQELPDGLDTVISRENISPSGGEAQRLAVAQALLYDRPVYIFDEITSGLDEATQQFLIDNLKLISRDKIMIFVTHRMNILEQFNRVFRFEDGVFLERRVE